MKKVRIISTEETDYKPFVVTFPQNHPSQRFLVGDEDDNEDLIQFDLHRHNHIKNKFMVHGHNRKFDWLGASASKSEEKAQGSKYLLGFYKEGSKNINITEVPNVFNLKQHFKDEKLEEEEEQKGGQLKYIEQKKLLVQEFGNTRSKRMLDALKTSIVTENKISEAEDMKNFFKEKAEEYKKDMEEKKEDPIHALIQSKRELLPEFDLEAREPSKIYNFFSLIPREEFDAINTKDFAAAVNKEGVLEQKKKYLARFVAQELEDIKSKKKTFKETSSFSSKLKCLIYLNWLLKFLEMRTIHKEPEKICEEMRMTQNNVKTILSQFFITSGSSKEQDKIVYTRNAMLTDKLICYILILALFYGDFEFNATTLIANLKIEPKKFIKYIEEIGATMKKKKEDGYEITIIKLDAPLKIKEPSTKRNKKK